jgi:hypothetical protein
MEAKNQRARNQIEHVAAVCGVFYPEDGGDTFLRNVGSHKINTAPHPEDDILHSHRRENLKSYTPLRFYLDLPNVHILFFPVIARTSSLVAVTRSAEDEGNLYSANITREVKYMMMLTFIMFAKSRSV